MTTSPADGVPLPDGLVLCPARPADLDQIGELLADRGEDVDAVDHRLVVEDPDAGWDSSAVVVDGDRVVATATLLDETVHVGDVALPAGQVELVATDEEYEGRGLMRALMGWAHDRSTARGHLVQVMIGIPYLYRRFGYEYAIDIPPARELGERPARSAADDGVALRPAVQTDVPALEALQAAAQATYDVALPHPRPRWRWLLEHTASRTWVLERDGAVVGSVRLRGDDDEVLVAEPAALDERAAADLLAAVVAQHPDAEVQVVHRAGTVTGDAWGPRLGPAPELAEQYYVRVPALGPVVEALRPVLARRIAGAGLDRAGGEIVLSTFGSHVRVPVLDDGALGEVAVGGRLQWPAEEGGAGVAPDQLGPLLLGPLGMHGLARRRPDVYPGPDEELFEALFPPLTADVLSYYLPW